jgi:Nif-specific regulatory protein
MADSQTTILVVDDEPKNVKLMEALLSPRGYVVRIAANGEDALQQVQQEQPALILLDVMMPGIDGFEVCKRLKDDPATRLIPIVIMTALDSMEDRIRGIDAGADDFLTKPVNRDELLARIRTSVRMKQTVERKIAGLVDLNHRFAQAVEAEEVLRMILESAMTLFAAEGGSIALRDDAGEGLSFTSTTGPAKVEQIHLKARQGIVGWVVQSGRGVVCNDVAQDPRFFKGVDHKTGFRTRSILCAPLQREGSVVGAIEIINTKNADGFTQEDLQLLMALGEMATAALARVKALASMRSAHAAFQEVVQDRYRLVVGESTAMQEAVRMARTVAARNSTVLLLGESGTGKEVTARAIHQWSPRANGPFVAVNCVTLTQDLLESELFGHEKGAFTGAVAQKKGKFELAEGGTIFLDEIGDIAPNLQAKLLRVLQEKEFQRVGGVKDIRTDVRIVAATNRDLRYAVQNGGFREDLYYRLNVVSITLPPLRERPDDLPMLVQHFLDRFCNELKRPRVMLAPDALALLQSYPWPGNVREMQNVIERAVVLAPDVEITVSDLPTEIRQFAPSTPERANSSMTINDVGPMAEALDAFQRALIRKALEVSNDNQTAAAQLLAMPQPSLSRLMRRLGLR